MATIDLAGMEDHRRWGAVLSDRVRELLARTDRSAADDDELVHTAHAARYHWAEADTVPDHRRLATGEWQLARVYAVLARPEPARHHAERSLAHCVEGRLGGFLRGAAYEALARAARLASDDPAVHRYLRLGREAAEQVEDEEDRRMLLEDLDEIDRWTLAAR
jgi:hypothetical protein